MVRSGSDPGRGLLRSERVKRIAGILWLVAALAAALMCSADDSGGQMEQPTPRTGVGDVKRPEAAPVEQEGEEKGKGPFDGLKFRFIGPPGNRVSAVVGGPGDPNVYYAGAASGGVWKSIDGGTEWEPVFDKMPAQSIGSIAIAPSDHAIVWAGTGETFIRSHVSLGNGVYRSTDAGKTWQHMGLEKT